MDTSMIVIVAKGIIFEETKLTDCTCVTILLDTYQTRNLTKNIAHSLNTQRSTGLSRMDVLPTRLELRKNYKTDAIRQCQTLVFVLILPEAYSSTLTTKQSWTDRTSQIKYCL